MFVVVKWYNPGYGEGSGWHNAICDTLDSAGFIVYSISITFPTAGICCQDINGHNLPAIGYSHIVSITEKEAFDKASKLHIEKFGSDL